MKTKKNRDKQVIVYKAMNLVSEKYRGESDTEFNGICTAFELLKAYALREQFGEFFGKELGHMWWRPTKKYIEVRQTALALFLVASDDL